MAKAFYETKRAQGTGRHATLRALAFQWIRILFRMWKDRKPYDDKTDTQAQSPLAKLLPNTSSQNPEIAKHVT